MFRRSPRGLLDFTAALLCLWAAAWHTPVGALVRSVAARFTDSRTTARPLLAYYSGGVYDAADPITVAPLSSPQVGEVPLLPPGTALGRGVVAALGRARPEARASADSLARRYQRPAIATPDDAAEVLARAGAELGTDDEAAVLAVFAGYEVAHYAVARTRAEGRALTLELLAARLPPASPAVGAASSALMLGTAYALSWPVPRGAHVSSPFGWRSSPTPGGPSAQLHTGVDLSVPEGTEVKAVADGVVRRASEDSLNGRIVILDHGHGVSTAYCHNSQLLVVPGQRVRAGELISRSGNTGRSTGPHLHYQLELARKPIDPLLFLRASRQERLPCNQPIDLATPLEVP